MVTDCHGVPHTTANAAAERNDAACAGAASLKCCIKLAAACKLRARNKTDSPSK